MKPKGRWEGAHGLGAKLKTFDTLLSHFGPKRRVFVMGITIVYD